MALRIRKSDLAPLVIIESPFAGDIEKNLRYVRACMRDLILQGEAPFASHALYTQPGVLDDSVHEERELGMSRGWHIMNRAQKVAIYTDLGWSSGMVRGYNAAMEAGIEIVQIRRLGGEWSTYQPGVDYAVAGGPPSDWHNMTVINTAEPSAQDMYFEVDIKQGYGVRMSRELHNSLVVELVKSSFRFGTYKD